ncbi:chemotaxis protein CheX [Legionella moravica]|nr:chemotaxis protein CheX [Legionella moravica]
MHLEKRKSVWFLGGEQNYCIELEHLKEELKMNKNSPSIPWIDVIAESASDYARQTLFKDLFHDSMNKNRITESNLTSLSGSYLLLTANKSDIELGFLSDESVLMDLARTILSVSPEVIIPRLDMMDAVNEVINIISGGVKSRVNDQITGGIVLGIPYFLEGDAVQKKIQQGAVETIDFAGMPVTLYVREETQDNL